MVKYTYTKLNIISIIANCLINSNAIKFIGHALSSSRVSKLADNTYLEISIENGIVTASFYISNKEIVIREKAMKVCSYQIWFHFDGYKFLKI